MASKTWEDAQLFFAIPDKQPGFRLHRLEVFNWGTFNQKIWVLEVRGQTSLLTGDIGSGKSSLVDAVTTLLVAPQRITYNMAAGADRKERSLRSYVLGYYKSERNESGYTAKPVMLRDENSYSVILGTFHNEALGIVVTLAQVFWVKDKAVQPERFYVVAHRDLSIERDFSRFGNNMNELKRRLAGTAGCTVKDSFKEYEAVFNRALGIKNPQALDLFNQAVSMKSVGNLTQFVREHMLEPFDVQSRIDHLIHHFDDLNRAHEAVLKAKNQLEILVPLVQDGGDFERIHQDIETSQNLQDALPAFFARQKARLLETTIEALQLEVSSLTQKDQELEQELQTLEAQSIDLRREIDENGGHRLEQIGREIADKESQKLRRKALWDKYQEYVQALGLTRPSDAEGFVRNRAALSHLQSECDRQSEQLREEREELSGDLREEQNRLHPLAKELESLKQRKNNIPEPQIEIRRQLARSIGAREQDLAYGGELIQVLDQEVSWEGAIERLLHNFGLSLLVPEDHYAAVAEWVNKTHLNGRLVYYRVRLGTVPQSPPIHPQSVVHKVQIAPDSPFYDWLAHQLASRFNYACAETMEQFRREPLAMTKTGQIKGRDRHEKDDRHRISDRTRFVLGWDNTTKIAALERERQAVQTRMHALKTRMTEIDRTQQEIVMRERTIERLEEMREYQDLDWGAVAADIVRLTQEKADLEGTSDLLRTLQKQLEDLLAKRHETQKASQKVRDRLAVTKSKIGEAQSVLERITAVLAQAQEFSTWLSPLENVQEKQFRQPTSVDDCTELERAMRDYFSHNIRSASRQRDALRGKVTTAMARFQAAFPVESREMDARIEALSDYRTVMSRLQADDLPRFESKFKTLLNENTIREIVQFQAKLTQERDLIRARVEQINHSLVEVDYNPGRYIRLDADQNPDRDVREFQQSLRACTENSLTGSSDDQYSEAKFLQVKAIVERFRGREGFSDRDRLWTTKVTDVRNEFTFSASERFRADDTEHEHYSDSGGKSGGQKEKLAYTILAASLAYQFGLDADTSKSFRFVVIDEAFGRGSDESAQFGLELFRHLNLQLLIVTPLQKIHVIDPYVSSVGFVHNVEGKDSQLRNVTIEEYRAEREARRD